jgi:hypothetical protein
MVEICPLCGRYTLTQEYPPKPCSICEEELSYPSSVPPRSAPSREAQRQQSSERRPAG